MKFQKGHKINLGRRQPIEERVARSVKAKKQWSNPNVRNKMIKSIKKAFRKIDKRGKNSSRWNGGIKTDKDGYILQFSPHHPMCSDGKYVRQHRLVIEKILGYYLKKENQVHHIGKKNDNRPHKLICFSSNSAHRRFHFNPKNVLPSEIIFDGRKLKPQSGISA